MRVVALLLVFLFAVAGVSQTSRAGIDRWSTEGPYGGRVDSAALSPAAPQQIFAASHRSVYRSSSGGQSWVEAGVGLYGVEPGALRISASPQQPGLLLAAGGRSLFATTDGGRNWYRSDTGLPQFLDFSTKEVRFAPSDPQRVYLVTRSGLYRSDDAGQSWSAATGLLPQRLDRVAVDPADADALLVWSRNRDVDTFPASLYRSSDGGASFSPVAGPWDGQGPLRRELALLEYNGNVPGSVFLAGDFGQFRSLDGGLSFAELPTLPLGPGQRLQSLAFDPATPGRLLFGSSRGVLGSTDNGQNFTVLNSGLSVASGLPASIGSLLLRPDFANRVLAFSLSGDTFSSFDGGASWQRTSSGLVGTPVSSLALHPQISGVLLASIVNDFSDAVSPGIFSQLSPIAPWNVSNGGLDLDSINKIAFDPAAPPVLSASVAYALGRDFAPAGLGPSAYKSGLFRSLDGGVNWAAVSQFALPVGVAPAQLGAFRALAFGPGVISGVTQTVVVGADAQVECSSGDDFALLLPQLWRSSDGGGSFFNLSPLPAPGQCLQGEPVFAVPQMLRYVSSGQIQRLFAGTRLQGYCPDCVLSPPGNGLFYSDNNGQSWVDANNDLPKLPDGTVFDVVDLVRGPGNRLLLAVNAPGGLPLRAGVLISDDGGQSWTDSSEGLPGGRIGALLTDFSGQRYLAAVSGDASNAGGVFVRRFDDPRWLSVNIGLPPDSATALALVDDFSGLPLLHVGTERGVWSLSKRPDEDRDGPGDLEEDLAPNMGDGNLDGIFDRDQPDVASFVISSSSTATRGIADRGTIGNIDLLRGNQECLQLLDAHSPELSALRADRGFFYPAGLIAFEVFGCDSALIEVFFHDNDPGPQASFRRFGPEVVGDALTIRWLAMGSQAQWSGGRWLLTLVDNEPGDLRSEPQRFVFIGGPAIADLIYANGFQAPEPTSAD